MEERLTNSNTMVEAIKQLIPVIKRYIKQKHIIILKNNNFEEYKRNIQQKFKTFNEFYPHIISLIIKNENLDMLDYMLESINNLNQSQNVEEDLHNIRFDIGHKLHDIYVKSKVNN